MLVLRKIVSTLLMPLNICLALLISGGLLILLTGKQKAGKALIITGVLFLLCFSSPQVAGVLTRSLESRYQPVSAQSLSESNIRWIVVLGGGHDSSRQTGLQLTSSSLARVVEAIRIYRSKPGRKLIVSGGGVFDPVPNAQATFHMSKILGVREEDILTETKSKDTEEEVKFLASMIGKEKFYLVTSAIHMPRSVSLFQKQKMNPVPAPTDYAFRPQNAPFLLRVLPNATSLQQSERAMREYLGITWSRLRGKA
ncbi:YdcF family protein [bacterium]|nr:YdcF family protein [bacterium]